jgi:hypothetical protein
MAKPAALTAVIFIALSLAESLRSCDASIQVVDLGRTYPSRPDKYVGLQMRSGLEYAARLQRIPQNEHLCEDGRQWNVTVPKSGQPSEWKVRAECGGRTIRTCPHTPTDSHTNHLSVVAPPDRACAVSCTRREERALRGPIES